MRKWRRTAGEVIPRERGRSQDLKQLCGPQTSGFSCPLSYDPQAEGCTHISAQTAQVCPSLPSDFSSPCSKCAHDWGVSGNTQQSASIIEAHHFSPEQSPTRHWGRCWPPPSSRALLIYRPQEEAKPLAWPRPSPDPAASLKAMALDSCPLCLGLCIGGSLGLAHSSCSPFFIHLNSSSGLCSVRQPSHSPLPAAPTAPLAWTLQPSYYVPISLTLARTQVLCRQRIGPRNSIVAIPSTRSTACRNQYTLADLAPK